MASINGDDFSSNPNPENTSNWSDLPKDLLFRISILLDWKIDLTRIRGVCTKWRSSLPLHELPMLLTSRFQIPDFDGNLNLILPESRFYLLSPKSEPEPELDDPLGGRWLARMAEIGLNKRHLFNPLNIHEYFFAEPPVTGSMSLLDTQVLELSRTFTLVRGKGDQAKPISKKVVGGWSFKSSYMFSVLVLLEEREGGGLWLWRLRDTEWTKIQGFTCHEDGDGDSFRILDIAFHGGKFYVFDLFGWRIAVLDPENSCATKEFISAPDILGEMAENLYTLEFDGGSYFLGGVYMVVSNGSLHLVIEANEKDKEKEEVPVIVFVLKQQEQQEQEKEEEEKSRWDWERVRSLGDEIFFIGYDVSFSLTSSSVNFPQWKQGSICLFTRPFPLLFDGYMKGFSDDKIPEGIECLDMINFAGYWRYFRMFVIGEEDKGCVPFKHLSTQVYTGLFFPPPAWVQWRCPTLDNVEVRLDRLEFPQIHDEKKFEQRKLNVT